MSAHSVHLTTWSLHIQLHEQKNSSKVLYITQI